MRLAIFLRAPEVWGAEKSLLTLLSSDAAKKHEISLFVSPGSPLATELRKRQLSWQEFEFVNHSALSAGGLRAASPLAIISDMIRILRQAIRARRLLTNYDAALTFGLWETAEIALAGRFSKTPVIFDFHVTFAGRLGQSAIKGIAALTHGVLAPSLATYRQAGLKASPRMRTVPRPVSFPPLADFSEGVREKLTVGIFGQVDDRKRVLDVVRALAPLAASIDLLIVGLRSPEERTAYEHEVVHAVQSVGNGWQVLGRTDKPLELMERCHVVLNASHQEAFGRTVVEAAGMGAVPVVLSGGGPEEIVRDIGLGFVVSSIEQLSSQLSRLSSDLRCGKDVRLNQTEVARVRASFSPDTLGQKYFDAVESLSSPAGRRRL